MSRVRLALMTFVPNPQFAAAEASAAAERACFECSGAICRIRSSRLQPSRNPVLHLFTCKLSRLRWIVVGNQNITLSLPEEDLREARILAASRGTSVSQLLARMLRELVEQETGYARARDRSLARLREGMDLGTGGHITWSRDSVHER
jgi:hypothetical protein